MRYRWCIFEIIDAERAFFYRKFRNLQPARGRFWVLPGSLEAVIRYYPLRPIYATFMGRVNSEVCGSDYDTVVRTNTIRR